MWADVFGNAPIALAIADRLCYHCHLIRLTGSSYRIKDLPAASLSQRRAQAPILADSIAPAGADILPKSVSLGLTLTYREMVHSA
ncbi:MAG: ATP-binding protein [Coriobacteriaceae bacterium]